MEGWSDDDDFVSAVKGSGMDRESSLAAYKKQAGDQQRNGGAHDPKVQTSFSIGAVVKIVSKFSDEKRKIVQSMGFGGLLCLEPLNMFPRILVLWLIRNMDTKTGTITLPSGDKLTVSDLDVHLVLGIPHGARDVSCRKPLTAADWSKLRSLLMSGGGMEIGLREVESVLDKKCGDRMSNEEIRAFKIALLLYIDAYFLAPRGNNVKINTDIIRNIADTDNIHNLNWSGYVLQLLLQSAKRVQRSLNSENRTATLDGCLLFWVVFYLDNIDFGVLNSEHNVLPRVLHYSCDTVRKLCKMEKENKNIGGVLNFGINKLRSAKLVVYSRNKNSAEMVSRANKAYQSSESNDSKDVIEGAVNELIHWLERVKKETEYTKMKLLETMRRESFEAMQRSGALSGPKKKSIGTKMKKRIAYRTSARPKFKDAYIDEQMLVEVSSNSTENDGVLTAAEESYVDKKVHTQKRQEENCGEGNGSEVCNYLTGGGDSTKSDDSCVGSMMTNSIGEIGIHGGNPENYRMPTEERNDEHLTDKGDKSGEAVSYSSVSTSNSSSGLPGHGDLNHSPISRMRMEGNQDGDLSHSPRSSMSLEGNKLVEYLSAGDGATKQIECYAAINSPGETSYVELHGLQMELVERSDDLEHQEEEKNVYDFCPTPISIRRDDHNEIVQYGRKMSINDMEVDVTEIEDMSRFGVSPFVINMTHRDSSLEKIFGLQKALNAVHDEENDMIWYMNEKPSLLQIQGKIIHRVVKTTNEFTIDMIDGLVRMYQHMDDQMYENWSEKRWRHYLQTDFAIAALNPDINFDSSMVEKLFLGDHISYLVGECRLVIAILMVDWHWCSYVWDFKRRNIAVLDPACMTKGDAFLKKKHCETITKMHEAMKYCKQHFFPFPEEDMDNWGIETIEVKGANCVSNDSGLYTMFYARYFDGEVLTRILTKESSKGQRCNMICQLLGSKGNKAQPPECIREAVAGKRLGRDLQLLFGV